MTGMALYIDNDSTVIQYTTVQYSQYGLIVNNLAGAAISPTIAYNTFTQNGYGLYYYAAAPGQTQGDLHDNQFSHNTEFPLMLDGTAYPTFSNNTFSNNTHPAIGLTGWWDYAGSWPAIVGDGGQVFPYAITNTLTLTSTGTITVPAGTVFKAGKDAYLDIFGVLNLQSTPANPIVFTAYTDDSYKGDTNADGTATMPQPGDWDRCVPGEQRYILPRCDPQIRHTRHISLQ